MRAGIPTLYSGVRFRSRLEAKWAAFFDGCGWGWEYEPLDLDGWIPDFMLFGAKQQILVEVKPDGSIAGLREHCAKIEAANPVHEVLLVGCTTFPTNSEFPDTSSLGLLMDDHECTEEAVFGLCTECERPTFCHAINSFHSRMCGHYDGNPPLLFAPAAHAHLADAWARACNVTQWKRSA